MESPAANLHPEPFTGASPVGKRKRPWLGIVLIALLIGGVVLLIAHKPKPKPEASALDQPPVVTIKTATVRQGDMGIHVEALGTVTPVSTVSLYSQVTGRVVAVNYREGQMVRKGQSLIEIDPRPYEAQLKQAQGTLQHDQGLLKQAEIDLARYQKAVARDAIAHQTLDDQEQAVEQYKGTVKNDEGQVEYQQVQLSYCHITAPASGRMGLRLVDPGNTVFAGNSNALAVVTQLQPITVVFNVAEDNLSQVRSQILRRTALPVDAFDRSQMNDAGDRRPVATWPEPVPPTSEICRPSGLVVSPVWSVIVEVVPACALAGVGLGHGAENLDKIGRTRCRPRPR